MCSKYDYSKENLEKLVKESASHKEAYYKLSGKWGYSIVLAKYIKEYDLDTAHWIRKNSTIDTANGTTDLQKEIIKLRKEGKKYKEIKQILNCAESTITYSLSKTKRIKSRLRDNHNWRHKLSIKICGFFKRIPHIYEPKIYTDWLEKLKRQIVGFRHRVKNNKNIFGIKEVLAKHNNQTKVQCYLTGDWIDITKDFYALDHIIPIAKNGQCTLDNLAITTYEANQAKGALTEEEFVDLCKKVLEHHGYKVELNS